MGSLFLINGLALLKGYRPLFYHMIERDRYVIKTTLLTVINDYDRLGSHNFFFN